MKTIFVLFVTLASHVSFAASLHCDIWESEAKEIATVNKVLPAGTDSSQYFYFTLTSIGNADVVAEVAIAKGFSENVNVFTKINGISAYGGTRLLLTTEDKKVVDARCEILNPTPYKVGELPSGPKVN